MLAADTTYQHASSVVHSSVVVVFGFQSRVLLLIWAIVFCSRVEMSELFGFDMGQSALESARHSTVTIECNRILDCIIAIHPKHSH